MMKRIFYILLPLLLMACSEDERFTMNRSDVLTFAAEGVKVDTVFSGISSSTYSIWLHNNNSDAIRIMTAQLADGTKGFRVNVDGEYANPAVTNVEVLEGDSLLVFVELTPVETGQMEPQELSDELVLTLESGTEQRVPLKGWAWDAEVWKDVTITTDTQLTTQKPILVYGKLVVAEGATLTVTGSQLYFHDGAGIDVYGRLICNDALLRGDRLDYMFSYLPYDRISGQWKGVVLQENAECQMTGTTLRNAHDAVTCLAGSVLTMERCVVHNNEGVGINATTSTLNLSYCQVSNTAGDLIALNGGTAELDHCTLAQYYPFSAGRGLCLSWKDVEHVTGKNLLLASYGEPLDEEVKWKESSESSETEEEDKTYRNIDWTSEDGNVVLTSFSVAGKDDFLTIDEDNLYYDFHLSETSEIMDAGCY